MNEIDKNKLAITKLIQETQKELIQWFSYYKKDISLPHDGEVVGKIYITKYKNRNFRLFRYKYKDYSSDFETFYWESEVKLEIVDDKGDSEWEFPIDNSLHDLYEAVRYKVADINTLIDEILGIQIVKAIYGTSKKAVDVTNELINKIENEELHIIASNDIAGDPDPGILKVLKITYRIKGKTFFKEVK